ncbi:MAG: EAL domain-containing protein [Clostridia bacterium]|nr:EAL domain-containing protein [Clostridia bacterium]
MGMAYMVQYRRLFSNNWMMVLFAPFPFIIAATIFEFYYPNIVIELFCYSLALVFVYMNIHRPEEDIDPSTGLGNPNAYERSIIRTFQNGKPVIVALITVLNYDSVSDVLDYESNVGFKKEVAKYLFELNKRLKLSADMYYVNRGRFIVVFDERKERKAERAISMITRHFNSSQVVNNIEIRPRTSVCIVRLPYDIPDAKTFLRFAKSFIISSYDEKLVYAADILSEKTFSMQIKMERIIIDALDSKRFEVYYQPIYDIKQKKYVSAEALLRLRDPEFGFISPSVFIPAAENNGYINKIWDFVIDSVCKFIASDEYKNLGLEYIEVNLSAVQCMQERLAEQIFEQIDSRRVPREKIRVEITETAMMANSEILIKTLNRLNEGGIRVCLDDYGTGYSNTRRLVDLPLSIVKIDKSFIQDIDQPRISSVVNEVVHMLKGLDVEIVAEGVETKEMLEELEACGVDYIQGYYLSPPMPKTQFVKFLKTNQ